MSDEPQSPEAAAEDRVLPGQETRPEAEPGRYGDLRMHEVHTQVSREKEEPTELNRPVNIAVMSLMCFLFAAGGYYATEYSGDWRADVFDPDWQPGVSQNEGPSIDWSNPPVEELLKLGGRIYSNNCQACHQANGQGLAGAFPPLDASPWVLDSEERFAKLLLRGLQGQIEVLGAQYNGVMPSYGENGLNLKNHELAAVMTYVRQSWSNSAAEVMPDTIAAVREEIADKSGAWSPGELWPDQPD